MLARCAYPSGMRTLSIWIPHGDAGTRTVLRKMVQYARQECADPSVRQLALDITQGVSGRDGDTQAQLIRNWLAYTVQFTRDPAGVELLYTPRRVVNILREHGPPLRLDCDDVSLLAAALGMAVGLRARYVVVGFSPKGPMSHVWTELAPPRSERWYEMDVTRAAQGLPSMTDNIARLWTIKV